jgi:hypothetical protein
MQRDNKVKGLNWNKKRVKYKDMENCIPVELRRDYLIVLCENMKRV